MHIMDLYIHDIFDKTGKLETSNVNLHKIITLFFILIFGFSSVFVGISTPFIDEGEYAALHSSVLFVRNRVQPDDVIAGFEIRPLYYYLDLYEFDTACISLRTLEEPLTQEFEEQIWVRTRLDKQLLFDLRPKFIIENGAYFNHFYNDTTKRWVFENYELVHSSRPPLGYNWIGTEFYTSLVFERKN